MTSAPADADASGTSGTSPRHAPRIRKEPFGTTPDGKQVERYTFSNGRGVEVQMLTYGATIQTLRAPDRYGRSANITLGLPTLDDYLTRSPYFGATIGRYGNRIAKGRFVVDGKTYQIPPNDGENALHGGPTGFDKHVWTAQEVGSGDATGAIGVAFTLVSPDATWGSRAISRRGRRTRSICETGCGSTTTPRPPRRRSST